ncbi:hypothetical protein LNJ05_00965 [Tenacibaculum finnmarkense genomovar ulcerans]|uniref:hypothetical protein n=1 Tax=Tenacibaculum finnmarkense TaxID=2781243 RepID=UPI001E3D551C|nr:hypothetical protein [Tenacibaculum finnmarkense]MCD8431329.1 hypothetical protein [Tenacibaculum finnmarkense genomovar ulcerans]MCG8806804.1 hypothetical protein [Tenacibaculum finnmarkense]MCG8817044.1 hypothetical protein [Tenacibaculum finnmarkense]
MKTYLKLICYISLIAVLYSCKTTKPVVKEVIEKVEEVETNITFKNSLNISLKNSNNEFIIENNLINKLSEELIFKDIAPSYYMNIEGVYTIPKNIRQITSSTKYELYDYYFDKKGRLDSLYSKRNGSYKVNYNKNGLIDYIKKTKTYKNSKRIKSTKYLTYFATDKNTITKYETNNKNLIVSNNTFSHKFIYNNKGEIIKTNYNELLKGNFIEYYTFNKNLSTIKLIKARAGTYFFIKGYKLDNNGKIINTYFTNYAMDLNSNSVKLDKILYKDDAPALLTKYDKNKRVLVIENNKIKHIYKYY